jgi:cytosine/adenosine deaminase-related metal-dependent hydrolase
MGFALRARVVFPVDRPAIEHGVVTIDGQRIVAVGTKPEAADVTDLGNVALLPGLVNAHTHLEFSHLGRPLGEPGMRLPEWIRLVIAERGRRDITPLISIISGVAESALHGVTTLCDVATGKYPVEFCLDNDIIAAAEVIGFSRARAASSLSAVIERLNGIRDADGGSAATTGHGVRCGISPHAPYTVSPQLLDDVVDLATSRKLPLVMHVAESREELELLRDGTGPFQALLEERSMWDEDAIPRGSRPLDYLRRLAEAPRALVIHGNYLDDEEQSFLAERADRMSLIYCPRTHNYFGHSPYPLAQLLSRGVRVALGTDSRASNPDLDLLAEMRHVAQSFPEIDPQAILRMGTLSGAEALGRAEDVGSIAPGKFANMVAVPLTGSGGAADEMLAELLSGDPPTRMVWIRGARVPPGQSAPT